MRSTLPRTRSRPGTTMPICVAESCSSNRRDQVAAARISSAASSNRKRVIAGSKRGVSITAGSPSARKRSICWGVSASNGDRRNVSEFRTRRAMISREPGALQPLPIAAALFEVARPLGERGAILRGVEAPVHWYTVSLDETPGVHGAARGLGNLEQCCALGRLADYLLPDQLLLRCTQQRRPRSAESCQSASRHSRSRKASSGRIFGRRQNARP